ncbi:MAG: hypothetical protein LUP99_01305 [Methanomicrobiales archaeon]|nr:hypothetical protein [Methanomicrobiales archaeon]
MAKRSFTKKPFRIKVKCEKDLDYTETVGATVWLYNRDPEVFLKIVRALELQHGEINCPFTNLCKKFPCETMTCNAIALDGDAMPIEG